MDKEVVRKNPGCSPQLDRGLDIGRVGESYELHEQAVEHRIMWCRGEHALMNIVDRSDCSDEVNARRQIVQGRKR